MGTREQRTRRWMFSDYWGIDGHVDSPVEEHLTYGKSLLMAANGDGALTEAEKEWILGYLATGGHAEETLAELAEFDGSGSFEELFAEGTQAFVQRVCIYDAIRASGSDGDLAPGEIAAIKSMAARLDVSDEIVDELVQLYRDEQELKTRRMALAFPVPVPPA